VQHRIQIDEGDVANSDVKRCKAGIINIQQAAKAREAKESTIESMVVSFFESDAMRGGSGKAGEQVYRSYLICTRYENQFSTTE
jgi:hypothetical protein